MTLTSEQWKEILDAVNPNEGDIFKQIKENLKKKNNHMHSIWKTKNFDINYQFKLKEDIRVSLLHMAAANGRLKIAQYLIDKGADVNLANLNIQNIQNILLLALKKNYPNVVKALVCKVPDVDRTVPDYRGKTCGSWTLLLWAAENGHKDVVDALIDKGADVNKVSELAEWAPLHLAARNGYIDIVNTLIDKGADVNKINTGRHTPISLAAEYGHVDVVRILINNGAKVNGEYSTHIPIGWAIRGGHKEVVELLT